MKQRQEKEEWIDAQPIKRCILELELQMAEKRSGPPWQELGGVSQTNEKKKMMMM